MQEKDRAEIGAVSVLLARADCSGTNALRIIVRRQPGLRDLGRRQKKVPEVINEQVKVFLFKSTRHFFLCLLAVFFTPI